MLGIVAERHGCTLEELKPSRAARSGPILFMRRWAHGRGGGPMGRIVLVSQPSEELHHARTLNDLRVPPANRLEALAGDRRGQHSIRINDQWRICFTWTREGPANVEIVDYHLGARGRRTG